MEGSQVWVLCYPSKQGLPVPTDGNELLALLVHKGAIGDADDALQAWWCGGRVHDALGRSQRQGKSNNADRMHASSTLHVHHHSTYVKISEECNF